MNNQFSCRNSRGEFKGCVPETKGRSLEHIQATINRERKWQHSSSHLLKRKQQVTTQTRQEGRLVQIEHAGGLGRTRPSYRFSSVLNETKQRSSQREVFDHEYPYLARRRRPEGEPEAKRATVGRLDVAPSQDHRDKSGSNPKKTHHVLEGVGWRSPVYVGDGCITLVRERSSAPGSRFLSVHPSAHSRFSLRFTLCSLSRISLSLLLSLSPASPEELENTVASLSRSSSLSTFSVSPLERL